MADNTKTGDKMKRDVLYYNIPDPLLKDGLSDFLKPFSFIPHGFGHQYNNPEASSCSDRIIGDFELIYVVGGRSCITILDRDYSCEAGDMVLIPPFTRHRIVSSKEEPHDNYWLHFDVLPFYRQGIFTSTLLSGEDYQYRIGLQEELIGLYRKLDEELREQKPGVHTVFSALLVQLLTSVFRFRSGHIELVGTQSRKISSEMELVNRSSELIQKNIGKELRIADLCAGLHISESYLFKAFSRVLGVSPNEFIVMHKMKAAEQMLRSSPLSIKEISEQLGFTSPYYFSSVFKKLYRRSPREYMNTCGKF